MSMLCLAISKDVTMSEAVACRMGEWSALPRSSWRDKLFQTGRSCHDPHREEASKERAGRSGIFGAAVSCDQDFSFVQKSHKDSHQNVRGRRKRLERSCDPNDERYYISFSESSVIGPDGTDEFEDLEQDVPDTNKEDGLFVQLLHNQVLNYKLSEKSDTKIKEIKNSKVQSNKEMLHQDEIVMTNGNSPAPQMPTPDYHSPRHSPLSKERSRQRSKSVSSCSQNEEMNSLVSLSPKGKVRALDEARKLFRSSNQLSSPTIPVPDYPTDREESVEKENQRLHNSDTDHMRRDISENKNVWANAKRYSGNEEEATAQLYKFNRNYAVDLDKLPRETLKRIMKNRPPIAEIVKEIAKVSEADKLRQQQRESMQQEAESLFKVEKPRHRGRKASTKDNETLRNEVDDAQKIYREILQVVKENSPATLQYGRGRMVGYGEEAQSTLRRGDKQNAKKEQRQKKSGQHDFSRIRLSEDRESITTSIDTYQFSPSSPWSHAMPSRYNRFGFPVFPQRQFGLPSPSGPVSFAGFSSPLSNLSTSSTLTNPQSPGNINGEIQRRNRNSSQKKKKWFSIF